VIQCKGKKGAKMIRKTAIIIGASSDIGLEIAKKFAKANYDLALTYNSHKLDFEKELPKANLKTYKLDLRKTEEIAQFFAEVQKDFKTFDSMVFCAGISQKRALVLDLTDAELDNLFEINTKAAIRCVREFAKLTANKNPSNITLIGSFVEKNGCSCESAYTSSKSAMSGLCKSLASELGNLDIRINVVAPGFIDTKMNNNLTKAEKEDIADMTPLHRLGTPEDIANATYFLSSDAASFITGQTLYVDGGLILE